MTAADLPRAALSVCLLVTGAYAAARGVPGWPMLVACVAIGRAVFDDPFLRPVVVVSTLLFGIAIFTFVFAVLP